MRVASMLKRLRCSDYWLSKTTWKHDQIRDPRTTGIEYSTIVSRSILYLMTEARSL